MLQRKSISTIAIPPSSNSMVYLVEQVETMHLNGGRLRTRECFGKIRTSVEPFFERIAVVYQKAFVCSTSKATIVLVEAYEQKPVLVWRYLSHSKKKKRYPSLQR